LPPRSVKLFEDETDLRLFPPLHSGWALRGQAAPVPISGTNAKQVLFGVLNIETGYRLFLERKNQKGVDFQAFLHLVRGQYRGWYIAMVRDHGANRSHL
jgi:hypothetical protein